MDDKKNQVLDSLKKASNVLITVSKNPSADQLAAAIGLSLMLNKLEKHATAVFSGQVPAMLEFLSPDKTLAKNTDSLRDFIIALDKSKADKLRYKVEDTMVKIFITPYHTAINEKDLEFSQGDFNIDVVIALGVVNREDIDEAISANGRILHDATTVSINASATPGTLGSINMADAKASSLCELLVPLCEQLKPSPFDAQMATAFLTGIVSETKRFSNEKTSSDTMQISARLMAAGANQQLIANQLHENNAASNPVPFSPMPPTVPPTESNTSLNVRHDVPSQLPASDPSTIHIDEHGTLIPPPDDSKTHGKIVLPPDGPSKPKTDFQELIKDLDTGLSNLPPVKLPIPPPPMPGPRPPIPPPAVTQGAPELNIDRRSLLADDPNDAKVPATDNLLDQNPNQPPPVDNSLPPPLPTIPNLQHGPTEVPLPPPANANTLSDLEKSVESPHLTAPAPLSTHAAQLDVKPAPNPDQPQPEKPENLSIDRGDGVDTGTQQIMIDPASGSLQYVKPLGVPENESTPPAVTDVKSQPPPQPPETEEKKDDQAKPDPGKPPENPPPLMPPVM